MSRCSLLLILALSLLLDTHTSLAAPKGGQPETLEQALSRHHIGLTKEALIGALRSNDAEGRSLAAQKLAQDHITDAIPTIVEALRAETVPLTRVSLAFSLAQLGSETGVSALNTTCNSSEAGAYVRMVAALYIKWMHSGDCQSAVIQVLHSRGDPDALIQALSLVPSLHLSDDDSKRAFEGTVDALTDESPGVRMTASSILGKLGNTSAVAYLEEALRKEQNESCILQMRTDLERLQKAQRSQ